MKKFWLVLLLVAMFLSLGTISCADPPEEDKLKVTLPPPEQAPNWQSVYEDNIKSIPLVGIEKCYVKANYCQDYAHGTGFVVYQGVVVTNYHLAEYYFLTQTQGTETIYYEIYVRYPATTDSEDNYFLPGKYYASGCYGLTSRDLALLKVDTLGNYPLIFAADDFSSLQQGDKIFLVSYPGSQEFLGSEGEINNLFINNGLANWIANDTKLIEHTAYTYNGSSGGPVFNDRGEIIGINFAGYKETTELSLALSIYYLQEINFPTIPFATRNIP